MVFFYSRDLKTSELCTNSKQYTSCHALRRNNYTLVTVNQITSRHIVDFEPNKDDKIYLQNEPHSPYVS